MGMRRNYPAALDLISQAVVSFPNFLPALVEKMKIQLAMNDWDQTVETAQRCVLPSLNFTSNFFTMKYVFAFVKHKYITFRCLLVDGHCLEAQRCMILYSLCREGNYPDATSKIQDLLQEMDRMEPKNPYLFDEFAKVFCRMVSVTLDILILRYLAVGNILHILYFLSGHQ